MSHPLSTAIYSYIPTGNPIEEEEDPQIHKQDGELKKITLINHPNSRRYPYNLPKWKKLPGKLPLIFKYPRTNCKPAIRITEAT